MLKCTPLAFLFFFVQLSAVAQTKTVLYQASSSDFPNPERGFYRYSETRSGNYSPLDQTTLEGYRDFHVPTSTANYSIYSTLVFRYFFLEDFKNSNISQDYLDRMQEDFNTARAAGIKLIPRFAYTDEVDSTSCSNWICPPYGDAPKSQILAHIDQLKPVLQNNKDVIAVVQMGLIGVWGENYYTDYFGDASQPPAYKLLDVNWTDRIDVLNALLDAVPIERMVQVRYPQVKQRTVYGISAPTNSNSLTMNEAFLGSYKARIGFHNDCFLASADDFGTYTDYGNSSSSSMSDTTNLKPYLANDSQFVAVGGETCKDSYNPQNNCSSSDPSAFADFEIERMHYSYLNAQYNTQVNNDWEDDGCMDEIKKRLGYRFQLQEGTFSNSAQPNQVVDINLKLQNVGYASPYNERGLELMFRNMTTSEVWYVPLDDDPRYWFASNTDYNISDTICIPSEIPLGTYEILLHLPDPMPSLHGIPEYSIRLANLVNGNDVWETTTGYNKLEHFIEIDNTSNNSTCNGEITLSKLSSPLPVHLINFQAVPGEKYVRLKWTTSVESNNQGYNLERRTHENSFSSIAWIKSNGKPNGLNDYAFIDYDIKNQVKYYYRLAQKDNDGKITYSKIVSTKIRSDDFSKSSIRIYPNPANNILTIDYLGNALLDVECQISILNSMGIKVYCDKVDNQTVDISMLSKGLYFIEIKMGQEVFFEKLVKK